MKFILGQKLNMTQIFQEDGVVVPVTVLRAGPCVVTQVKSEEKDGVFSVQVGFGEKKEKHATKPEIGHLKDMPLVRFLRDFRVGAAQTSLRRGDKFSVDSFVTGDRVSVTGVSKGKGFQGVVKRHGFHGSPKTHGHKDQLRMPGSIGAGGVQHVRKGKRMAGRMGGDRVTVKNLEVIKIEPENHLMYIKGAVPGARGGLLMIYGPGEIKSVN